MTKLRLAVIESGLPDYIVAGRAGIHHHKMSLYCQGKKALPAKFIEPLSAILEVPPESLIGWASFTLDPSEPLDSP